MPVLSTVIGTMIQHDSSEMMKNIQVDAHGKAHHGEELPEAGSGNGHARLLYHSIALLLPALGSSLSQCGGVS